MRGRCLWFLRLSMGLVLLTGALGAGGSASSARASTLDNGSGPLTNPGNSPVMHQVSVYTIFWLPDGMSFQPQGASSSDGDYMGHINQFFQDIGGSDYYDVLTQYGDKGGAIQNSVTLTDSVVDSNPYPDGKGSQDNPLLDSDMQHEIVNVIKAEHWKNQKFRSIFYIFTADGIQSCNDNPARQPGCTFSNDNGYCGYHDSFKYKKKALVYSVEPDIYSSGYCDANDPTTADNAPNADPAADVQINTVVHELIEAATDPLLNGWASSDGNEIGDICATAYAPRDENGGNVTLNNDHEYYLQSVYSNQDGGCVYRVGGDTVSATG